MIPKLSGLSLPSLLKSPLAPEDRRREYPQPHTRGRPSRAACSLSICRSHSPQLVVVSKSPWVKSSLSPLFERRDRATPLQEGGKSWLLSRIFVKLINWVYSDGPTVGHIVLRVTYDWRATDHASPMRARNSSSEATSTPRRSASASFDPASSPAIK